MSEVSISTNAAEDSAGKTEDIVTKDLLERALRSDNGRDITVVGFTITKGANFGDGFMSVVHGVDVEIQDGDEKKHVALVVKVMTSNPVIKEMAVEMGLFKKEVGFYKNILPEFARFQQEIGVIIPLSVSAPNFYYGYEDTSNHAGVVVLEDLRPQGYVMADMKKGFDYDHCCLVMKELSKLHALSFAFKRGKDEVIESKFGDLMKDAYLSDFLDTGYDFGEEMRVVLSKSMVYFNELVSDKQLQERVSKHFEGFMDDPFTAVKKYLKLDQTPYRVVCHGDTWGNNMMFLYDDSGSGPSVVDVKLIDMQTCRYALLTTDVSLFLFTCTTQSLRQRHLDDLLQLYHGNFVKTLAHVNAGFPDFTFEVFQEMFNTSAMFGVLLACDFVYGILGGEAVADGMSDAKNSEEMMEAMKTAADRTDAASLANMKERIVGILHDATEMGLK